MLHHSCPLEQRSTPSQISAFLSSVSQLSVDGRQGPGMGPGAPLPRNANAGPTPSRPVPNAPIVADAMLQGIGG